MGHSRIGTIQDAHKLILQRRARDNHRLRRDGPGHLRECEDVDVRDRQVRDCWRVQDSGGEQMRPRERAAGIVLGRIGAGEAVRNPFLGGFGQTVSERGGRLPDDDEPNKGEPGEV